MARKATVCLCCGFSSWNGRVCKGCRDFYGGTVENCVAARQLQRRLEGLNYDGVCDVLAELCDIIVPGWPGVKNFVTNGPLSAPPIPAADAKD